MLSDPRARRAYVLTKAAVLALALALTPLLARVIGPRAWWAFAAFAVVLGTLTLAMLATGRSPAAPPPPQEPADDEPAFDPDQPIVLPVEDALDLHPFAPRDIPSVVDEYLAEAHARGLAEVRLIHGRGIGVQRERVRSVLAAHPLVRSFHDAPPSRGGWGATVAQLVGRDPASS